MDQSVAIQETLAEGEYCVIAVQGVLCEGDSRQSRLLGLVRFCLEDGGREHALFLYTHRRMAITGDDVALDQIVPVSRDFTLEEVSSDGGLYILGSDVTVQLDTAQISLVFQLPFGSHTRMFLQEVARACPVSEPECYLQQGPFALGAQGRAAQGRRVTLTENLFHDSRASSL